MLQLLVPAFHGSTALEGVLMSSDRVATICSARTHNCEGSWLLEDGEWPVAAVLDRFSEFWDLSLPVLMVKSAAASESSYENLQYTQGSIPDGDVLPIPLDVSHAAPMPPRMVARGIGRLRPAYLMMWRPWCLAPLSSHARDKGAPSSAGWQRFELALNEYQVETHRVLTSHGESVLVLNYADLLWDATAARQRIERWVRAPAHSTRASTRGLRCKGAAGTGRTQRASRPCHRPPACCEWVRSSARRVR